MEKKQNELIDEEIKQAKQDGAYEMDLELIESLDQLKDIFSNKKVFEENDYVLGLYQDYLDSVYLNMDADLVDEYLESLKENEIIKNQVHEKENPFAISVLMKLQKNVGIDLALQTEEYTKDTLLEIYKQLVKFTKSEGSGFRDNNHKYVGTLVNGQRYIQYFPVDYKKIELILDKICSFINSDYMESEEFIFIKPIIIHGLLVSYQPFNDGNSRLARTIMHVLIHKLSVKNGVTHLNKPAIYTSKQSMAFSDDYRSLIKNLVINHDKEAWSKWIVFNLRNIETAIYYYEKEKLGPLVDLSRKVIN